MLKQRKIIELKNFMEEDKIKEAEVENVKKEKISFEEKKEKSKRDFYIGMVLFAVLGLLLGMAIKTEALKKISIGHNDYQMKIMKTDYDINKMGKDLAEKQKEASENAQNSSDQPTGEVESGGSCGE